MHDMGSRSTVGNHKRFGYVTGVPTPGKQDKHLAFTRRKLKPLCHASARFGKRYIGIGLQLGNLPGFIEPPRTVSPVLEQTYGARHQKNAECREDNARFEQLAVAIR